MDAFYSTSQIKEIAAPIAARHGVQRLYLFGSYARGDAGAGSDLDFRVDKGSIKSLFALGALYDDLATALKLPIDLLTTQSLEEDFLAEIQKAEVLLFDCEQQG